MTTGGQILVKALKEGGVERIFCVAGESYLAVLDALLDYPEIEVVTCRHESGATFMAEAYGQMTGKPGIAMVTRGPGACNGSIGIHAAKQSSSPVVMFAGLINSNDRDKESFQEFDIAQMFASLSKWSSVIDRAERISGYVSRALHVAASGRAGPVVLGLPEEILVEKIENTAVKPFHVGPIHPAPDDIAALRKILGAAKKPFVIVGGAWSDEATRAFAKFCGESHLPVASSLRCQDVFDHTHESYCGELGFGPNAALVKRIKEADVILAFGARLDEITVQGYTLLQKGQKLAHIYPASGEFGKAYAPDLCIEAHPGPVVTALVAGGPLRGGWDSSWCTDAREDYISWTAMKPGANPGWQGADMTEIFRHLRDVLPENAILTTDAGNFSGWAQRFLRYRRPGRMLAPVSGAMGYGVPAAIAASLQYPDRVVLGICGDGGFMMTGQELATAAHHNAKPVIMVCNNRMYGTIRMHQERDFPGRISGTALTNPDFVKLGESYGAFAVRVEKAEDFPAAWDAALKSGRAALIEICMDPRQITTSAKP
jgi:acetolactate synthase-1/2/3 large subunit